MKKLLLTAAISGLMTTGAFAHLDFNIMGCLDVKTIADQQKEEGNVGQFTLESRGSVWLIRNEKTAPKSLTGATAGLAKDNGFQLQCFYDNGMNANLIKKNCENFFKN